MGTALAWNLSVVQTARYSIESYAILWLCIFMCAWVLSESMGMLPCRLYKQEGKYKQPAINHKLTSFGLAPNDYIQLKSFGSCSWFACAWGVTSTPYSYDYECCWITSLIQVLLRQNSMMTDLLSIRLILRMVVSKHEAKMKFGMSVAHTRWL